MKNEIEKCEFEGQPHEQEEVVFRNPEIAIGLMPSFEKSFKKLCKTSERLGVEKPTYKIVRQFFKKVRTIRDPHSPDGTKDIFSEVVELEITGSSPKLSGWDFIAKADYSLSKEIPIMFAVPEKEVPEEFFSVPSTRCDHCNRKHSRKTCYVVFSEEEGFKFVGSTCLKDFLGHASPNQIANYWSFFDSLQEFQADSDSEEYFKTLPPIWTLEEILVRSATAIRMFGWRNSGHDEKSTRDFVTDGLFPPNVAYIRDAVTRKEIIQEHKDLNTPTEEDRENASKSLVWMQELKREGASGYVSNLINLAQIGFVSGKELGLAVSVVKVVLESERVKSETELDREINEKSEYEGELKARQIFQNTKVRKINSYMGNDFATGRPVKKFIYTFLTESENILVAFPTNELDIEEGDIVSFKATPKEHKEFKDTKQTVVNRIAFI